MSDQQPPEEKPDRPMTGRQAYDLVTDTVAGPNLRLKDNLYQGLAMLICLALGAIIGLFWNGGPLYGPGFCAVVGGFAGLLVGLFGSGIYLMIYRAVKHSGGEHD